MHVSFAEDSGSVAGTAGLTVLEPREATHSAPPALSTSTLSRQQDAFTPDRFSTTLESPSTGLKIGR